MWARIIQPPGRLDRNGTVRSSSRDCDPHASGSRPWLRLSAALVVAVVLAVTAIGLRIEQSDARAQLEKRFVMRAQLASSFVTTYVRQLIDRERSVATATLAGTGPVLQDHFRSDVAAFGFPAADLLDANGLVLAVQPADPALIGKRLASSPANLSAALGGHSAVSVVVPSTSGGPPVTGFATPFAGPGGMRVFSGAYPVADPEIQAFLQAALPLRGSHVFIVDSRGFLLADTPGSLSGLVRLSQVAPGVATARSAQGFAVLDGQAYYYARQQVPGTPWALVAATPAGEMFAPVSGGSALLPWVIVGMAGVLCFALAWLWVRLAESRRRLQAANSRLDQTARTDSLTGLHNRRHALEQLSLALPAARRYGYDVSVLLIDIDHFKQVNDTHGHSGGDQVLRTIARVLKDQVRAGDIAARLGGEEFLVVLPHADGPAALSAAERIRRSIAGEEVYVGEKLLQITASVGVATARPGQEAYSLLNEADAALYAAKAAGRNAIREAVVTDFAEVSAQGQSRRG